MGLDDELYCIGCGAKIQSENQNEIGYTPESAIKKGMGNGELYCQRCFRLRHYNEIQSVNFDDDDFLKLLDKIGQTNSLVVYVVDIFDFNGSLIPGLQRFIGNNPILLVGNKMDLIPSSVNKKKLKDWIRQQANKAQIKPIEIEMVSAKTNQSVDNLLNVIQKNQADRDVYVVGVTNVGKSTLINQIIRQNTGDSQVITTSRFPGTTLDQIEIPLDDGHSLIDTPGVIHREQMAHYLNPKDLKYVSPDKLIKPKSYQLNPEQTLFFGGLGRFDYIKGDSKKGFTVYVSNDLLIHRTKLDNADNFYEKHLGGLLTPPSELNEDLELYRKEFKVEEKSDVVIEGLGWITVPKDTIVAAYAPKHVSILIRKSMI